MKGCLTWGAALAIAGVIGVLLVGTLTLLVLIGLVVTAFSYRPHP